MAQFFSIHPVSPQRRLLNQASQILQQGGVIAYPTDSAYALGCCLGQKNAIAQIHHIRQIKASQDLTLICQDLSEIAVYAHLDNTAFRMIKSVTPGPYTFLLRAKRDVPKRLLHPKKRTIGIRIPANQITRALLDCMNQPIISISLLLPNEEWPETEPLRIREKIGKQIDLIIDGGVGGVEFTTIIDMTGDAPQMVRAGKGSEVLRSRLHC